MSPSSDDDFSRTVFMIAIALRGVRDDNNNEKQADATEKEREIENSVFTFSIANASAESAPLISRARDRKFDNKIPSPCSIRDATSTHAARRIAMHSSLSRVNRDHFRARADGAAVPTRRRALLASSGLAVRRGFSFETFGGSTAAADSRRDDARVIGNVRRKNDSLAPARRSTWLPFWLQTSCDMPEVCDQPAALARVPECAHFQSRCRVCTSVRACILLSTKSSNTA